jgi:heptosyltransferase-1
VRVLIVKTSSMGDVIHAMPMISDIARAFPHARIDWVVEEAFAEIPRLHPAITRVLPVALRRWRRGVFTLAAWRELLDARREMRRTRYHTVIDCQGLIKSAVVASWARGPVTGYAADSAREPLAAVLYQRTVSIDRHRHAIDRMRLLGAAALGYTLEPGADGAPDFSLQARVAALHAEPPFDENGAVLFLSNASRPGKRWPDDHWAALEDALARDGRLCLLAWGNAAERADCERRAALMHSARVLPRSSIAQIATLAARSALVVGLDTGLTHLAAAVGAPTVGIFCDYDPARVGLRGGGRDRSVRVASLGGVGQVPSVADVLAAIGRVQAPVSAAVVPP